MARSVDVRMFTLIRQWQGSGISQKDFCKRKDIPYATFHYWYKKFRDNEVADNADEILPSFVPVAVPVTASPSFCTVRLPGDVEIDFHSPIPAVYLNQLGK